MIDGSAVGWLATGEREIRAGPPQVGNAVSGAVIAAAPPSNRFFVVSFWLLVVSETQKEKIMSKKILGFTSRKWDCFWFGVCVGIVAGGLAGVSTVTP